MLKSDAGDGSRETVRLVLVSAADLARLEQFVRAYYVEDGHSFDENRQPAALTALAAGEPFGRAWLIEHDGRRVGYVVLCWGFSVEAGGREACLDEFYLLPEVRNRGLRRSPCALRSRLVA